MKLSNSAKIRKRKAKYFALHDVFLPRGMIESKRYLQERLDDNDEKISLIELKLEAIRFDVEILGLEKPIPQMFHKTKRRSFTSRLNGSEPQLEKDIKHLKWINDIITERIIRIDDILGCKSY